MLSRIGFQCLHLSYFSSVMQLRSACRKRSIAVSGMKSTILMIEARFQPFAHHAKFFSSRLRVSLLNTFNTASVQCRWRVQRPHFDSISAEGAARRSARSYSLRSSAFTTTAEEEGSEVDVDIIIEGQPLGGDTWVLSGPACPCAAGKTHLLQHSCCLASHVGLL